MIVLKLLELCMEEKMDKFIIIFLIITYNFNVKKSYEY